MILSGTVLAVFVSVAMRSRVRCIYVQKGVLLVVVVVLVPIVFAEDLTGSECERSFGETSSPGKPRLARASLQTLYLLQRQRPPCNITSNSHGMKDTLSARRN